MSWTYDAIIGFSNGMLKGNILNIFMFLLNNIKRFSILIVTNTKRLKDCYPCKQKCVFNRSSTHRNEMFILICTRCLVVYSTVISDQFMSHPTVVIIYDNINNN